MAKPKLPPLTPAQQEAEAEFARILREHFASPKLKNIIRTYDPTHPSFAEFLRKAQEERSPEAEAKAKRAATALIDSAKAHARAQAEEARKQAEEAQRRLKNKEQLHKIIHKIKYNENPHLIHKQPRAPLAPAELARLTAEFPFFEHVGLTEQNEPMPKIPRLKPGQPKREHE